MASLKVLNEQPDRIELGKGGGKNIGGLIGILVFGVVACVGLSAILGEGGSLDPVMIVIMLVIGIGLLSSLVGAISSTRVTVDSSKRTASRVSTLLFIPTQRQEISFNLIRDVEVTRRQGAKLLALDSMPLWQARLRGTDGSTLVLNDRGTRAEMTALAEQVSALLNRPVYQEGGATAPAQTPGASPATPASFMNDLIENLGTFAQSLAVGEGMMAPPVSAYPSNSPRPRQEDVERVVEESPYARASAQMAAQQVATGASARQANARMAQEQSAASADSIEAYTRMTQEQTAASADIARASAQMAQEQLTTGAYALQTNAQYAAAQAAAGASARETNAKMAAQQVQAGASARQTSARMATEQLAAGADVTAASAQIASQQAEAFRSDMGMQALTSGQLAAAGLPFDAASLRLAEQQMTAQAAMGYSIPPIMTMPQLPDLASFSPVLALPTFAPLGAGWAPQTAPEDAREIKEVQVQVAAGSSSQLDARALIQKGREQLRARNFSGAQEFYFRALNVNPADTGAQNDLGVVYYAQNKMQDAERAFRRALALDPFTVEGRYNLGLVLHRLGRRSEAQEQFRVGAQSAGREAVKYFQDALRGVLREPLLAAQA